MSADISSIVAPPLDLDLNTIDTSMPMLADGIYDLSIAAVTSKMTKANAPMFNLDLVTTSPSQSLDGNTLGAGVHVFHNLNLQPSGKATWDMVLRNIATVTQACGVATTYGEFAANGPALLQGHVARVKVGNVPAGVDKNGKAFRAKNEIVSWMKVA
jgi:hypothetical protein